jgi:hypothetical protein
MTPSRHARSFSRMRDYQDEERSRAGAFPLADPLAAPRRPHLDNELVWQSLDFGMKLLDPEYRRGFPPYMLGKVTGENHLLGQLGWYQARDNPMHVALFAMAVGVLNRPDLDWRFVCGDSHTVPVGYSPEGHALLLMDLLRFEELPAAQSLELARQKGTDETLGFWGDVYENYLRRFVPDLREFAEDHARIKHEARAASRA